MTTHTYAQRAAIMGYGIPNAFTGSAPPTTPPAPITSRAEAGKHLYNISSKPLEEQQYYLAARQSMARSMAEARRNYDRTQEEHLKHVGDEGAKFCKENGLNITETRQFMSGIAQSAGRPKTRSEMLPYDRKYLIEKHGGQYEKISQLAIQRTVASLADKPNLKMVVETSNAAVQREVVEPMLEATARVGNALAAAVVNHG